MAIVVHVDASTRCLIFRARLGAVLAFCLAMVLAWCVERIRVAGGSRYDSGRICARRS